MSPDRQLLFKKRDHLTPAWIFYISALFLTPPPPSNTITPHFFSTNSQTMPAFAFHMPGWLGDAAPCNSSQGPARERRLPWRSDTGASSFLPLSLMMLLVVWAGFVSQCSYTSLNPAPALLGCDLRGLRLCAFVFLFLHAECLLQRINKYSQGQRASCWKLHCFQLIPRLLEETLRTMSSETLAILLCQSTCSSYLT